MGMVAGNGGHPQDAVGLIDTRIYGNPEEIREAAAVIEKLHNTFYDAFIEMMNTGQERVLTPTKTHYLIFV